MAACGFVSIIDGLNAIKGNDKYNLPRMDECSDSLGGTKIFSALEEISGYSHMPILESDCDNTVLTFHSGL